MVTKKPWTKESAILLAFCIRTFMIRTINNEQLGITVSEILEF